MAGNNRVRCGTLADQMGAETTDQSCENVGIP